MNKVQLEQLRQLDVASDPESKQRYAAICERRDQVLTHAVVQVAQYLLAQTGFQADETLDEAQNNQIAIEMLQDYLSARSSMPEMAQRLLALVGRGALFDKMIPEDEASGLHLIGPTAEQLDPVLVHRIARALDRDQEQEPILWRYVEEQLSEGDDPLVEPAIRLLLDDVPLSVLDKSIEKMILDSIPGG